MMRDISAGGDIVNSPITEIVGLQPAPEILQQPAEELAAAEHLSRRIVKHERRRRAKRAAIFAGCALAAFAIAACLGYFWLLQGGTLSPNDLIHDAANLGVGALISTAVATLVGITTGSLAVRQRIPTEAEALNRARLKNVGVRWDELKALGLPRAEMKELRKIERS